MVVKFSWKWHQDPGVIDNDGKCRNVSPCEQANSGHAGNPGILDSNVGSIERVHEEWVVIHEGLRLGLELVDRYLLVLESMSSNLFSSPMTSQSGPKAIKLFASVIYELSLASSSSIVYCLWARLWAYPRVEHLKGSSIGQTPVLPKTLD